MTGAVAQDDGLADVIGEAISEADSNDGVVPEWGARTIARALAGEADDPTAGALYRYAVTGRIDRQEILDELAGFTGRYHYAKTRVWANQLVNYVLAQGEEPAGPPAGEPANQVPALTGTGPETPAGPSEDNEVVFGGSAVAKVNHYLQHSFAEADARDTNISRDDARVIATLLGAVLGAGSALYQFGEDDIFDRAALIQECSHLMRISTSPEVASWIPRLERYISTWQEWA